MQSDKQLIQIRHLKDYSQCPNFCKYNWNLLSKPIKPSTLEQIIDVCYRDLAFNGKPNWAKIRKYVQEQLLVLEPDLETQQLYKRSVELMTSLRNWYLEIYRDGPSESLYRLQLKGVIGGLSISGEVFTTLLESSGSSNKTTLVEFTELDSELLMIRDFSIRVKIWLLTQQQVKVNKLLFIKTTNKIIKWWNLNIQDPDLWNYKTEQSLKLIASGIKNNVYYPSVSDMCNTCIYKDTCSW